MRGVRDLIYPHAWVNDKIDPFSVFSQEFALYEQCLVFNGAYLRELLMLDVQFWDDLM